MLDEELDSLLRELKRQWNIAERRIKKAEQVRANEIVSAAIFELRYAGRKLVDAIHLSLENDWRNNDEIRRRIHAYLADAIEDCVKAKHDAIDSMMDFVARWFNQQENILGMEKIQQFHPRYLETLGKIVEIQDKIAESREDRTKLRDEIYDNIESHGFDEILDLYREMRLHRDTVTAVVRAARRKEVINMAFGVVGVVGVLIVIIEVVWPVI